MVFAVVHTLLTCTLSGQGMTWAWPTPCTAFLEGKPFETFVQPTATGDPVSALFGCVRNSGQRFHEGLDIRAVLPRQRGRSTDPIYAVHDGVVRHINRVAGHSSYGIYIVLEHPELRPAIYTLYSHLRSIETNLRVGQTVAAGQRIGIMGNTAGGYRIPLANSHLHLEVGLRLSDAFQGWFDRQNFGSDNHHGNFNGMNLRGWDPLAYFTAMRDGRISQPLDFILNLPVGAVIHIYHPERPDFLKRYPELELSGVPERERTGWQIALSGFGLPMSLQGLSKDQLQGVARRGEIAVISLNQSVLQQYGCRDIIRISATGEAGMGTFGRRNLELIFGE